MESAFGYANAPAGTRDVNLVGFLESISNRVMGLLLNYTIWFVKFPIQILVLGIEYLGSDGELDPCLEKEH